MNYSKLTTVIFAIILPIASVTKSKKMIITKPIVDLLEKPKLLNAHIKLPMTYEDNPLQLTQLLLGEYLVSTDEFIDKNGDEWLKVNALQQLHFWANNKWEGFPGWILKNQAIEVEEFEQNNIIIKEFSAPIFNEKKQKVMELSIGTRLCGTLNEETMKWKIKLPDGSTAFIDDDYISSITKPFEKDLRKLRKEIIESTKKLVGCYYSWGGRSAQTDELQISSVDCSALMQLGFLVNGLQIPRMSHEQFLTSEEVQYGKDLQPGDLIFYSSIPNHRREPIAHLDHVMMYLGDDLLLETTPLGESKARIISFTKRVGKPVELIESGDVCHIEIEENEYYYYYVYFSTYFKPELLEKLYNYAIQSDFIMKRSTQF